ncbi:MAG: lipopolysaccharide biosynthesis protein [Mycobacteriales bacterium]
MSAPVGAPNSRIAAHTVLSMIAVAALGLTRLIFALLVGQRLGADALGTVNTQLSIATFASLVFATSTSLSASKFISAALGGKDEVGARQALLTLLRWCALGTAAAVAVLAVGLPIAFPRLSVAQVAATLILLVAYSAYLFVRGAQYGYGTVRRYAVLETLCDAVSIAAAVVVVFFGLDLILLLPFVVGYTLFTVFGWIGLPKPARSHVAAPALRTELRREMLGYTGWGGLGVLASTGFLQLSMVFAYHFNTPFEAGLYASAFNLTVPAFFVPRALSMALFPSMAGAFGRGDAAEVRRQVDGATRFLLVGGLPFFAAGVFFAEPVLRLTFGAEFAAAHLVLELLLAATYVMVVGIPAVNAFSATHRKAVRIPATGSVLGLLLGIICWVLLGPRYGIAGIGVGYLAGVILTAGISLIAGWRRWHLPWSMLFLRAGLVIAVAVALRIAATAAGDDLLLRFGATLAVAACTVVFCLPEVRRIARQLSALVGALRRRVAR